MGLESENFLKDYCGVLGIVGPKFAADYVAASLEFLQHRGQDSAGVVSFDKETRRFYPHRDVGLVAEVFTKDRGYTPGSLPGNVAIGHVRYSTAGSNIKIDAQPIINPSSSTAMCHNGDITNPELLEKILNENSVTPSGRCDVEYLLHIQSIFLNEKLSKGSEINVDLIKEATIDVMKTVKGAYSVLELIGNHFVAFRDPLGFKPLVMGETTFSGEKTYGFASESLPLTQMGFDHKTIKDIPAGNCVILMDGKKPQMFELCTAQNIGYVNKTAHSSFEFAYFSNGGSWIDNSSMSDVRHNLGISVMNRFLKKGHEFDVIAYSPDTSRPAAAGASSVTGVPFDGRIIIKNRYESRRSFIQPRETIGYIVDRKLILNPWRAKKRMAIF